MEKLEQSNMLQSPKKEDLTRIEELERRKKVKRENRLKKIVKKNSELLQSLFPEEADKFEITYEEIQERYDSIFEETVKIPPYELPAYGIVLRLKSHPEETYQIMYWLRPDLDAKKEIFEILLKQSFADRIKEAVEKLKLVSY